MKVLIADDDPICRSLVTSKLSELQCNVVEAEDGSIAWATMGQARFDLAIIDLEMPNIDGLTLIQCIRGHPRTKHMPVMVLTSRQDNAAVQSAFAAGATSFLVKPVQWTTFVSHVEYLMRLSLSAEEARIRTQQAVAACNLRGAMVANAIGAGTAEAQRIINEVSNLAAADPDSLDPAALVRALDIVVKHAQNIEEVMVSAFNKTKAISSVLSLSEDVTPIAAILDKARLAAEPAARNHGIAIRSTASVDNLYISGDSNSIATAIEELLLNATHASVDNGEVIMDAVEHAEGMIAISIADNGHGMDPDHVAAHLGSDIALDDTKFEQGNWNGVGIPLAKSVAEAHGGKLEIRSAPGSGTTAIFVIPADRVLTEGSDVAAA